MFSIDRLSRFDAKSMAGRIIPAIATTNAIIAGAIVLQAYKVLDGRAEECRAVTLAEGYRQGRGRMLHGGQPRKPNPACIVCNRATVTLVIDTETATMGFLNDAVLKRELGMIGPDVDHGPRGLLCSDEDDAEDQRNLIHPKTLAAMAVHHGAELRCTDDQQDLSFTLVVSHSKEIEDAQGFVVTRDACVAIPKRPRDEASPAAASPSPDSDRAKRARAE